MEEEHRIYNGIDEEAETPDEPSEQYGEAEAEDVPVGTENGGETGEAEDMADMDAFTAQIEKRRRERDKRRVAKKRRTVILLIVVLGALMTMCGKEIVRLKAENIALKKQQKELEAERDKLSEELKKSEDREYVEEKAREQLRLLNDGEILFIFDDDGESSKGADKKDE